MYIELEKRNPKYIYTAFSPVTVFHFFVKEEKRGFSGKFPSSGIGTWLVVRAYVKAPAPQLSLGSFLRHRMGFTTHLFPPRASQTWRPSESKPILNCGRVKEYRTCNFTVSLFLYYKVNINGIVQDLLKKCIVLNTIWTLLS